MAHLIRKEGMTMVHLVRTGLWRGAWLALTVASCLSISTVALRAQTTSDMATIEGTVLDPDNKAVVNAAVVVRNTTSGDVRATVSDASGRFVVDLLVVGTYDVEA